MKTGQVLLSVVATKKILSYGVDGNAFRYVTFNRLLQAEVGFTRNEPGSLAVEQAIDQAVLQFIVEGSARGLWAFRDKAFQSHIIEDYELSYLAAQAKAPPSKDGPQAKVVAAKGQAPSPAKTDWRGSATRRSPRRPAETRTADIAAGSGAGTNDAQQPAMAGPQPQQQRDWRRPQDRSNSPRPIRSWCRLRRQCAADAAAARSANHRAAAHA